MNKIKLTSSEIGALWGEYVNGTMAEVVNQYMVSIIEDQSIKAIFEDALKIFAKQKKQMAELIENEGFPIPIGFTDSDLNSGSERLFSDLFCLNYIHIMTIHGLLGHISSLCVTVRPDLRDFFHNCDNVAKQMYNQTLDLLLEKGSFQRTPYFYPNANPEFISSEDFTDGFFGKGRRLSAPEVINISLNLKKTIMAKTLCIGFSQVAQSTEVRKFFTYTQKMADKHIRTFSNIMQTDNLPVPTSWETEVTTSTNSPFSDKLMMFQIGFLAQVSQAYHGTGLASSMRSDLIAAYEGVIIKNLWVTKKWFNIMEKNKWLEQPPLAPNREEIAREK
jgi:hypothetical protein